jgi:hypothetical protein
MPYNQFEFKRKTSVLFRSDRHRSGSRQRVFRALPQVISIVDFSKGLGHSDVVTVGADQTLELTEARADNWGPDPAIEHDAQRERGDAARAD